MKKSIFSKLLVLGAGSALCFGGILAALNLKPANKKASAASNSVYYFSPDSDWAKDGASFKMSAGDDTYYPMIKVALSATAKEHLGISTDLYSCEVSGEFANLKFRRCSSDGNSVWNTSGQLTTNGKKVFIKNDSEWNSWTGVYAKGNLDAVYKATDCSRSETTGRIFYYNSNSPWGGTENAVRAWGGSAGNLDGTKVSASLYMLNWFQDESVWYGYVDIPTDINGFQFVQLNGNTYSSCVENYQKTGSFNKEDGCFAGVYYAWGDSASEMNISMGGANNDKAGSTLLEKVFSACYACSSSALNGYGAANKIYDRFYSHAVSGSTSTIVDTSYTIEQKMAQMAELYNKANPTSPIAGYGAYSALKVGLNDSGNAIATCAVLATLTVGFGLILLKKKKVA